MKREGTAPRSHASLRMGMLITDNNDLQQFSVAYAAWGHKKQSSKAIAPRKRLKTGGHGSLRS